MNIVATALLLSGVAVMTGGAQAESPQDTENAPSSYICSVAKTGDFGDLEYGIVVYVQSGTTHWIKWQNPKRAEGAQLSVTWSGPSASVLQDDHASTSVVFKSMRRIRGEVRIEIRRADDQGSSSGFAYAGQYGRVVRYSEGPEYAVETIGRWSDLRAWMNGQNMLTVALVGRDGAIKAADRVETRIFADVATAIAEMRPKVEAMARDFKNNCEPVGEIVIADQRR